MNKAEKTVVIEELVQKLNANNKIYLADCSSLTVEKVNAFRKACFEKKSIGYSCKKYFIEKSH